MPGPVSYTHLDVYKRQIVENIFKGIRPAVVALIAAPTFSMAKSAKINRYTVWIPITTYTELTGRLKNKALEDLKRFAKEGIICKVGRGNQMLFVKNQEEDVYKRQVLLSSNPSIHLPSLSSRPCIHNPAT